MDFKKDEELRVINPYIYDLLVEYYNLSIQDKNQFFKSLKGFPDITIENSIEIQKFYKEIVTKFQKMIKDEKIDFLYLLRDIDEKQVDAVGDFIDNLLDYLFENKIKKSDPKRAVEKDFNMIKKFSSFLEKNIMSLAIYRYDYKEAKKSLYFIKKIENEYSNFLDGKFNTGVLNTADENNFFKNKYYNKRADIKEALLYCNISHDKKNEIISRFPELKRKILQRLQK